MSYEPPTRLNNRILGTRARPYSLLPDLGTGCTPFSKPLDMRAVAVRLRKAADLPDTVQPGTPVDVLWGRNFHDGRKKQTTTVLKNVTVLAVTRNSDPALRGSAVVVTLLVSPDDAVKLAAARSKGRIQIANHAAVREHPKASRP
jgi:Flp pilus assembly protein CpaB